MIDSEILKIILEALKSAGIVKSLNDLAKKLPHNYASLYRLLNGQEGYNLTAGIRDKLAKPPFNISREFMSNGIGDVFEMTVMKSKNGNNEAQYNLTLIPIKAQGGFLNGYESKAYIDSLESYPFPWVKGRCFGFEVEGFSMVGDDVRFSFYPGEWVVCTELESFTWLSKGKVYVFATVNGICIKQFDKIEDNKFFLKSLNTSKEYEVKPIPMKEIKRAFHIERKISTI